MNDIQNIFLTIQRNPILLIIFSVYTAILKGLSLWKAAKNSHKYWFIGILIINLFGIPEILYLLYFSKRQIKLPSLFNKKEKSKK